MLIRYDKRTDETCIDSDYLLPQVKEDLEFKPCFNIDKNIVKLEGKPEIDAIIQEYQVGTNGYVIYPNKNASRYIPERLKRGVSTNFDFIVTPDWVGAFYNGKAACKVYIYNSAKCAIKDFTVFTPLGAELTDFQALTHQIPTGFMVTNNSYYLYIPTTADKTLGLTRAKHIILKGTRVAGLFGFDNSSFTLDAWPNTLAGVKARFNSAAILTNSPESLGDDGIVLTTSARDAGRAVLDKVKVGQEISDLSWCKRYLLPSGNEELEYQVIPLCLIQNMTDEGYKNIFGDVVTVNEMIMKWPTMIDRDRGFISWVNSGANLKDYADYFFGSVQDLIQILNNFQKYFKAAQIESAEALTEAIYQMMAFMPEAIEKLFTDVTVSLTLEAKDVDLGFPGKKFETGKKTLSVKIPLEKYLRSVCPMVAKANFPQAKVVGTSIDIVNSAYMRQLCAAVRTTRVNEDFNFISTILPSARQTEEGGTIKIKFDKTQPTWEVDERCYNSIKDYPVLRSATEEEITSSRTSKVNALTSAIQQKVTGTFNTITSELKAILSPSSYSLPEYECANPSYSEGHGSYSRAAEDGYWTCGWPWDWWFEWNEHHHLIPGLDVDEKYPANFALGGHLWNVGGKRLAANQMMKFNKVDLKPSFGVPTDKGEVPYSITYEVDADIYWLYAFCERELSVGNGMIANLERAISDECAKRGWNVIISTSPEMLDPTVGTRSDSVKWSRNFRRTAHGTQVDGYDQWYSLLSGIHVTMTKSVSSSYQINPKDFFEDATGAEAYDKAIQSYKNIAVFLNDRAKVIASNRVYEELWTWFTSNGFIKLDENGDMLYDGADRLFACYGSVEGSYVNLLMMKVLDLPVLTMPTGSVNLGSTSDVFENAVEGITGSVINPDTGEQMTVYSSFQEIVGTKRYDRFQLMIKLLGLDDFLEESVQAIKPAKIFKLSQIDPSSAVEDYNAVGGYAWL